LLSIDIGSKQIKILNAKTSAKQISVLNYISLPTPKNTMQNGIITDFDKIADVIGQEVVKHRLRGSKTAVIITSPDIVVREIKLPKTNVKNIKNIVNNEMNAFLGGEKYTVQFFLQNQDKTILKAHTFAIPMQVAEDYKKMLSKAFLYPLYLDTCANCIRKIHMGLKYDIDDDTVVVSVDIGHSFLSFNLFYKNNLLYTRCVKSELDDSVKPDIDKDENSKLSASYYNMYLTYIGDQIHKILQFLASSEYRDKKTVVSLCGGGANFPEIDLFMQDYLSNKVVLTNNIKHSSIKEGNLKEFINALGAQIRL